MIPSLSSGESKGGGRVGCRISIRTLLLSPAQPPSTRNHLQLPTYKLSKKRRWLYLSHNIVPKTTHLHISDKTNQSLPNQLLSSPALENNNNPGIRTFVPSSWESYLNPIYDSNFKFFPSAFDKNVVCLAVVYKKWEWGPYGILDGGECFHLW